MNVTFFIKLFSVCFAFGQSERAINFVDSEYKLVWSDEFTQDGRPDTLKWRFEDGYCRNQEAQWYQAENAICEGGYLVIFGKKEHKVNPNYQSGTEFWKTNRPFVEYTSSSLVMRREHAFMYGKLEVKAKLDAQMGLWPAIWTLGVEGEWPSNGEVDVMEYYNNGILANFAMADSLKNKAIWDASFHKLNSLGGAVWANAFHIWTLEWDEMSMRILVDGVLLNDIDIRKTVNLNDGRNPFHQPHFVLLNLAMGGTKGGSLEHTVFPTKYMVDYVRVYQKLDRKSKNIVSDK